MLTTPLKCPHKFVCSDFLKKTLDQNQKIVSFAFSAGTLEIDLHLHGYDLLACSNRPYIMEFWDHLQKSPTGLLTTIRYLHDKVKTAQLTYYRDNWTTIFDRPHQRAAMFYLLNRYSDSGLFSRTAITKHNFSPLNLSMFQHHADIAKNLKLGFDPNNDFCDSFQHLDKNSILLIPIGEYKKRLLIKNTKSPEAYNFNHQQIKDYLLMQEQKVMLIYKYNKHTDNFYDNKIYINKYGDVTENPELAEDLIVSNF